MLAIESRVFANWQESKLSSSSFIVRESAESLLDELPTGVAHELNIKPNDITKSIVFIFVLFLISDAKLQPL